MTKKNQTNDKKKNPKETQETESQKNTLKPSTSLNTLKSTTLQKLLELPEVKKIENPELLNKEELFQKILTIKIEADENNRVKNLIMGKNNLVLSNKFNHIKRVKKYI